MQQWLQQATGAHVSAVTSLSVLGFQQSVTLS
jgi:hypothetical protein